MHKIIGGGGWLKGLADEAIDGRLIRILCILLFFCTNLYTADACRNVVELVPWQKLLRVYSSMMGDCDVI